MNYIFILILSAAAALMMIFFPQDALNATKKGITLWLNIVLPALFPFFVCAKVMTYLGIPKIIGRLFEPIMRPVFKVPGEASFVYAISITSGYPIGVELISEMRRKNTISKNEAERMLSFCSTSGPLFILGAVGVGMFSNSILGWSIAISHYIGALLNGLFFRFYGSSNHSYRMQKKSFWETLNEAKVESKRPFIVFLSEAILDSFKALLLICGYIIIFSIVIALLEKFSLFNFLSDISHLVPIGNLEILPSCIKGFLEITLGCSSVSEITGIGFTLSCFFCAVIISWSGLSIHAQALTFLSKTDVSSRFYIFSKIFHSLFTGICAVIIAPIMKNYHSMALQAFNFSDEIVNSSFMYKLLFSTKLMILVLILFGCTAIISQIRFKKK